MESPRALATLLTLSALTGCDDNPRPRFEAEDPVDAAVSSFDAQVGELLDATVEDALS